VRDERALGTGALVASIGVLLYRLLPDVRGLPYHSDEAVSGLVAIRPFREMLDIVVNERGGPPLHYLLAHFALAIETSATSLRALSVVAAVAAMPVIYDLGRRLGGPVASGGAALVAVFSPFMDIYGTFGRPYALFILTSALALDLFVRALETRTLAAAALAALATVLATATHTYGAYLLLVEGVIGLALWRFRPKRGFVVVAGTATLLVPIAIGAQRLSERFSLESGEVGAHPRLAARQVFYALMGSSAGRPTFWIVAVLALIGLVVLARRRLSLAALAVGLLAAPPAAYLFVSIRGGDGLSGVSPRHLLFLLPLWTALIGLGVERLGRWMPTVGKALALAGLAVAVAFTPIDGVFDVRTRDPGNAANGERATLAGPAQLLEREIAPNDVLYPHSQAFLAALPATERGFVVMPGVGGLVRLGFEHVRFPVPAVVVAVPIGPASVSETRLAGSAEAFDRWVVIRLRGPFEDEAEALRAIARAQASVRAAATGTTPGFAGYFRSRQGAVCRRLRELRPDEPCLPPLDASITAP
jgi:Dolichyl-phosphate-mannose-protein mannosyltransferase